LAYQNIDITKPRNLLQPELTKKVMSSNSLEPIGSERVTLPAWVETYGGHSPQNVRWRDGSCIHFPQYFEK